MCQWQNSTNLPILETMKLYQFSYVIMLHGNLKYY